MFNKTLRLKVFTILKFVNNLSLHAKNEKSSVNMPNVIAFKCIHF